MYLGHPYQKRLSASSAGVFVQCGTSEMRIFPGFAAVVVTCMLASSTLAEECQQAHLYEPASQKEVARAGWPWCHWTWARRQNPCNYTGYYVGGGAPGPHSRGPCPSEGTWGWDYQGRKLDRIVRLGWTCPSRSQGGTGSYDPDGSRVAEAIQEAVHSHHGAE